MRLVFETGEQADLDERQIVVGEELFGSVDAAFHQVMLRRLAGRFAERAGEVELAEPRDHGELGEGDVLFEIVVYVIGDAAEFVARQAAVDLLDKLRRGAV